MKEFLSTIFQSKYYYVLILIFLIIVYYKHKLPVSIQSIFSNQIVNIFFFMCILYYQLQSITKTILVLLIVGTIYMINQRYYPTPTPSQPTRKNKTVRVIRI